MRSHQYVVSYHNTDVYFSWTVYQCKRTCEEKAQQMMDILRQEGLAQGFNPNGWSSRIRSVIVN